MKKLTFILLVSLLASCDNLEVAPGPGPLVSSKDSNSLEENPVENNMGNEKVASELESYDDSPARGEGVEIGSSPIHEGGPYSNPFFIYATDFGNFFQTMYQHARYGQMMAFTSSVSIDKFAKDVILDFYKNELDFGYNIGDYPLSSGTNGDTITINYKAKIMATDKIVRVNVIIENDSCKIVLPDNLENFPS